MATRGRKPNVETLRRVRSDRAKPGGFDPGTPEKPEWLEANELASEFWDSIVPGLEERGVLSPSDQGALELLCTTYANYRLCQADVQEHGPLTEAGSGGFKANPAVAAANQFGKQLQGLLAEFGLTPVSRARILGGSPPKDKLDEFLKEGLE